MESTEKHKEASRSNGALGGVKTQEGKIISRMNAMKHGVLSQLPTKFDLITFEEVFNDFAEFYGVTCPLRKVIVEQLTVTYIRLLRCMKFESDKFKQAMNPPEYRVESKGMDFSGFSETKVLTKKNDMAPMTKDDFDGLDLVYSRYEPQFFKRFQDLVKQLEDGA